MLARSLSHYLPFALLALSTALTMGNWYLRPERAMAWSMSTAFLGVMLVALLIDSTRRTSNCVRQSAGVIRGSVGIAALIMGLSLTVKLVEALGLTTDPDWSRRASLMGMGVFLMFMGNSMPKTLTPLAKMRCNPASVQAFQRFAGWTWVLTGLGFSIAWLVLPLTVAKPVSMVVLFTGMFLIFARMARWRWA